MKCRGRQNVLQHILQPVVKPVSCEVVTLRPVWEWDAFRRVPDNGSFVRSGAAYYQNPTTGIWTAAAANEPRFETNGLKHDGAATNLFLNSGTPATQNINLATTGTYCCWIEGAGSATVAANSATITGAGAATAGTPVVFVVTGAGTVDVTIAGVVTICQVEKNPVPTSYIPTAGAAASRATEAGYPRWTLPASVAALFTANVPFTVAVKVRPGFAYTDVAPTVYVTVLSVAAAATNLLRIGRTITPTSVISAFDGANYATATINWAANTTYCFAIQIYDVAGTNKMRVGYSVCGSGTWTWGTAQNYDGAFTSDGVLRAFYGNEYPAHLQKICIFNSGSLTDAQLTAAMQ